MQSPFSCEKHMNTRPPEPHSPPSSFSSSSPLPVENPLSSLFDLAEEVSAQALDIKKKVKFAMIFIAFWLGVNLVFFVALFSAGQPFRGLILFVVFIFGIIALKLTLFTFRFFGDFSRRHAAIKSVREREIFEPVPEGINELDRFVSYLKRNFLSYSQLLYEGIPLQKQQPGYSMGEYPFELALMGTPPSFFQRFLSDEKTKALFIKVLPAVTMMDFHPMEAQIQHLAADKGFVPELVVIVQNPNADISDELYHYLTQQAHSIPLKGKMVSFPIQLAREIEGAYDFIPYLVRGA